MGRFIVDEARCRRDGICAAVCPAGILTHSEAAPPGVVDGGAARCISCGHCVAACPHGACSLDTMPSGECPPVRPEWRLGPEQAEHFLRSRRSIRVYRDALVDQGRLERLIRIARHAPSGHNSQPVRWLVLSGRERVREIAAGVVGWMRGVLSARPEMARRMMFDAVVAGFDAGRDPVCRGAPHLIVAHAPKADLAGQSACTLALAYLELAAPALGLGACWAGYVLLAALQHPPLPAALGLPAGEALGGAMLVGEPRYRYHRLPLRREPQIIWR